ncbi:23S rRNA (adenine(2030)-N(6))-methyltransferase RlmJ [Thiorhodococcus minor]|uniref:23S rRNA (Adenine(2030)-N(6))-methyltransferase RlmJ n=1 Tax=Thiorhodococcus minor TaxID=57489 RepID=A0A6M0JWG4_9GAMM|nr:23S rRNA (adenine(2030)-N(6))-methyltransferase RlmJ [Thiorhodococcus minor]NEV61902.1 23S rRNA (adenine(2030)-N(6))-methyltransferase RlmJ [Thiorhodococcus minor]
MYRHDAHAGNHGDVLKHAVLTLLLDRLRSAPGPRLYAETHAGAGVYRIASGSGEPTASAAEGIGRLWARRAELPELSAYFEAIGTLSPTETPSLYPGSPWLASRLLAPEDRLLLFEIQEDQAARLQDHLGGDERTAILRGNGLAGLPERLSGRERTGLILIDPPYSHPREDALAFDCITRIRARWPSGAIALWYPRHADDHDRHQRRLTRLRGQARLLLSAEIKLRPMSHAVCMLGSGVAILDGPDGIEEALGALLPRVAARLLRPSHDTTEEASRVPWRLGSFRQ